MKKIVFMLLCTLFLALMLISCTEDSALEVNGNQLTEVEQVDLISDDIYRSGSGLLNGNLRSDRVIFNWLQPEINEYRSYRLFRDNIMIFETNNFDSLQTIDLLLAQNSKYFYKIATFNKYGMAIWDTITVKTAVYKPVSLFNYRVKYASSQITFDWKKNSNAPIQVDIYRKSTTESDYTRIATSLTDTVYVDNNVVVDVIYNYQIFTRSPFELDTLKVTFMGIVNSYNLGSPTLYNPIRHDSTMIELNWDDNFNGEKSFEIYRGLKVDEVNTKVGTLKYNETTYFDYFNMQKDSTYYYKIEAVNPNENFESIVKSILVIW